MTYDYEPALALRTPRAPDAQQDRRLNLVAALVVALLGLALAWAPPPAAPPASAVFAYGD